MPQRRLGLILVVLTLAPAAAAAQNREHQQMFADVRMLQEQVQRLQQAATALGDQLKAVNKRLDDQAATAQKDAADQRLVINNLSATVNTVREKLDVNTVAVNRLAPEIAGIREGITMVTTSLNQMLGLLQPTTNPSSAIAAGTEPAPPPQGAVTLPPSPQAYFNQAFTDFSSSKFEIAISGFKDVIEKFPNAADYTARAQYYIGESYFQQGKFREAIAAYGLVITKYPEDTRVPDAMFNQGVCYQQLGQKAEALRVYTQVMTKYPDSSAALNASQRVKQIK